jgi:hypothetical protein
MSHFVPLIPMLAVLVAMIVYIYIGSPATKKFLLILITVLTVATTVLLFVTTQWIFAAVWVVYSFVLAKKTYNSLK